MAAVGGGFYLVHRGVYGDGFAGVGKRIGEAAAAFAQGAGRIARDSVTAGVQALGPGGTAGVAMVGAAYVLSQTGLPEINRASKRRRIEK